MSSDSATAATRAGGALMTARIASGTGVKRGRVDDGVQAPSAARINSLVFMRRRPRRIDVRWSFGAVRRRVSVIIVVLFAGLMLVPGLPIPDLGLQRLGLHPSRV